MNNKNKYYLMCYYCEHDNTLVLLSDGMATITINLNNTDNIVSGQHLDASDSINYDKLLNDLAAADFLLKISKKIKNRNYTQGYILTDVKYVNIKNLFSNKSDIKGEISGLYQMSDNIVFFYKCRLDISMIFSEPSIINLMRAEKLKDIL